MYPPIERWATVSNVPFLKGWIIDWSWLYIPLVVFVITGTSNAVNLTDGLDGLAVGLVAIAVMAFAAITYVTGRADFSRYLDIIYLPGSGELTVFCMAVAGASLGFLWYNCHPARIFMGDTGALALGGVLGVLAVLVKNELLLLIIGGVFVAVTCSVILQRLYFKYYKRRTGQGRRIFRMAPLQHHFELSGWPESKVVVRFWIIGILLALLSLSTFKIR
jgi:phospho-N-acetylmuramoyl-pentapeptide-transferase